MTKKDFKNYPFTSKTKVKKGDKIFYGLDGILQVGEILLVGEYSFVCKNISLITDDILLETFNYSSLINGKFYPHIKYVARNKQEAKEYYDYIIKTKQEEIKTYRLRLKRLLDYAEDNLN